MLKCGRILGKLKTIYKSACLVSELINSALQCAKKGKGTKRSWSAVKRSNRFVIENQNEHVYRLSCFITKEFLKHV